MRITVTFLHLPDSDKKPEMAKARDPSSSKFRVVSL